MMNEKLINTILGFCGIISILTLCFNFIGYQFWDWVFWDDGTKASLFSLIIVSGCFISDK